MDRLWQRDLVVDALEDGDHLAAAAGVIHRSDQGSRCTSPSFGKRCRDAGIALSMGSVGDRHDDALAESFFANLKCKMRDQAGFRNHAEAKPELFRYIAGTTRIVGTPRSDTSRTSTSR